MPVARMLRCLLATEHLALSGLRFPSLIFCGIYASAKIPAFVVFGSFMFVEPLLPLYFFRVRVSPNVLK